VHFSFIENEGFTTVNSVRMDFNSDPKVNAILASCTCL